MNKTLKILRYSFLDMLRSKWVIIYIGFFLVSTFSLLYFSVNLSKAIVSLMNIVLTLIPLISTILGVVYYYSSLEFVELLLAQPVRRRDVFLGKYLGLSISLVISFVVGMGIPFLIYGVHISGEIWNFSMLLLVGVFLTFIFTGIAFFACIINNDKIKGFGLAILIWLFMAVVYDGLFLLILVAFQDYPLEKTAIGLSMFNPIDLARTLVMLKLDIAALLGYTGAVFNKFFGNAGGIAISLLVMLFWVALPLIGITRVARKKDF